jgi:hypothetical protein
MKPARGLWVYCLALLFAGASCKGCFTSNTNKQDPILVAPVLTATAFSSSEIDLAWTFAATNETGFQIDRDDGGGAGFQLIATLTGTTVMGYADRGLFPLTPYTYRVRAINSSSIGPDSNTSAATTLKIAWTSLTFGATAPTPRANHAAIFAPLATPQMFISGGADGGGIALAEVWSLDLSPASTGAFTWTAATAMPAARLLHSAIFAPADTTHNPLMIVFGGLDLNFAVQDNHVIAWDFTTGKWIDPFVAASALPTTPTRRLSHSAIYDPVGKRMIVFGGDNGSGMAGNLLNDVWELPLAGASPAWNQLTPTGTPPDGRSAHAAIYDGSDPQNPRMIVFGGNASSGLKDDVWSLSLSGPLTWTLLSPAGTPPLARSLHTAICDTSGERLVAFAGDNGAAMNNLMQDVWIMNLTGAIAWKQQTAIAAPLSPARSSHTAIYDPVRLRMIVFGGLTNSGTGALTNDLWSLGF